MKYAQTFNLQKARLKEHFSKSQACFSSISKHVVKAPQYSLLVGTNEFLSSWYFDHGAQSMAELTDVISAYTTLSRKVMPSSNLLLI